MFAARPPTPEQLVATVASPETLVATAVDSALHGGARGGGGAPPPPPPPPHASRRASAAASGLAGLVAEGDRDTHHSHHHHHHRGSGGGGEAHHGSSSSGGVVAHTYAESYPYRQRVILLWQRLDGVDVLLFAMYVQEHGADAPPPNTRKVYIAYLDSVRYLRPITARTACYHELLAAYLSNARQRGYESAFIWACECGGSRPQRARGKRPRSVGRER